jgi:hypothetical protein
MNIRLILWATILTYMLTFPPAVFSRGPAVGSMSEWGVPYTPCAVCDGTNDLEIHHIYPRHLYPALAHDTNFMISLCRVNGKGCHWYYGHDGKSWTNAVTNLLKKIREQKRNEQSRTLKASPSNLVDVVTTAVNAVGGPDADWRVQAGAAALIIVIGTGSLVINRIKKRRHGNG